MSDKKNLEPTAAETAAATGPGQVKKHQNIDANKIDANNDKKPLGTGTTATKQQTASNIKEQSKTGSVTNRRTRAISSDEEKKAERQQNPGNPSHGSLNQATATTNGDAAPAAPAPSKVDINTHAREEENIIKVVLEATAAERMEEKEKEKEEEEEEEEEETIRDINPGDKSDRNRSKDYPVEFKKHAEKTQEDRAQKVAEKKNEEKKVEKGSQGGHEAPAPMKP